MRLLQRVRNRLRWHAWFDRPYLSEMDPIVIGGCGRSGTTILRVILDTHPDVSCGPESNLFTRYGLPHKDPEFIERLADRFDFPVEAVWEMLHACKSHAEFIEKFFSVYLVTTGKSQLAEKTPANVHKIGYVFKHFPRARFVHVVRDGRDTVCSLRTHPRHRVVDGELVPVNTNHPISKCVRRWTKDVRAGLRWRHDPRYVEVRYENMIEKPEETVRSLLHRLGLPWHDKVMEYHAVKSGSRDPTRFPQNPEATRPMYNSSIGRWVTDLSDEEKALVDKEAGTLLRRLGYADR